MLDQITAVLLRYNEEQNISRTLSHLARAKDMSSFWLSCTAASVTS